MRRAPRFRRTSCAKEVDEVIRGDYGVSARATSTAWLLVVTPRTALHAVEQTRITKQGWLRDRYVRRENTTHLRCPDRTAGPRITSPGAMPVQKAAWEGRPAAGEEQRDDGWSCPREGLRVYTQVPSAGIRRRGEEGGMRREEG
jgi:hypothetical protein